MTNVTFLHGAQDRVRAIASWLANPQRAEAQIVVYVPDIGLAAHLDRLLWCSPATGFVAHCWADDPLAQETPVVLASSMEHAAHDGCLVNFSDEIPPDFLRFKELIEIVSINDADRLPGRDRFRFYREQGLPINAQEISSN